MIALRKKCPYSQSFWSVFSRIRTEYGSSLIYRNFNEPSIKVHNASKIYGPYSDLTFEGDDGDDELIFTDASHGVA